MSIRYALIAATAFGLAVATPAYAKDTAAVANTTTAAAPVAKKGDEKKEVQAAFTTWRETLSSGKPDAIVALYAPDAVLLATLSNEPITDQKARTKYFEGLMKKEKLAVTLDKEMVRVLDEDDAVISGTYTFSFEDAGKPVKVPARYTYVFKKGADGKWLISEHHSSKFPMDK